MTEFESDNIINNYDQFNNIIGYNDNNFVYFHDVLFKIIKKEFGNIIGKHLISSIFKLENKIIYIIDLLSTCYIIFNKILCLLLFYLQILCKCN